MAQLETPSQWCSALGSVDDLAHVHGTADVFSAILGNELSCKTDLDWFAV